MAAGRGSSRERAEAAEAAKVRKQKIFIGIAGGLLVAVVGFQLLPSLFGSSSSSDAGGGAGSAVVASPAVPIGRQPTAGGSSSAVPKSITKLKQRDLFLAQVGLSSTGTGGTIVGVLVKGPPVRLKKFVAKDIFIPQVTPPVATQSSTAVSSSGDGQGSAGASAGQSAGGGYIIVVDSIPGVGAASEKAAARALVAARNAGLKDVVANDSVPGSSGSAPHFTIYTGPYEYESSAQTELARALHNGYPHARAQQLPSTSGKGF
ncbi:MAG TPA: hypothetical protein VH063_01125 [Gaiellaceae bacterium]|jgi:hypothetical protein|nr:hypothetical protein [Gaiellaceae bacterium]